MTSGRNLSIASLAALTSLGVGFGAWSGLTGPNVAGVQLEIAGRNLAAASSLSEVIDITESVIGTPEVVTIHETVIRNAPDRIKLAEHVHVSGAGPDYSYTRTLTQIGGSCWTTVSSSQMIQQLPCEASTVRIRTLTAAETDSGVTDSGGVYSLSQKVATEYLRRSVSSPIGMVTIQVRITGEYVTWEHVAFYETVSGGTVIVDQTTQIANIDHAPRILEPAGPPTATVG
jgi:hypothetical protein